MLEVSDNAILLKKIEYKEQDYILSLFTKKHGKISVLAKNAKKSIIRFQGTLDLFNELSIVYEQKNPISFLKEATLETPFMNIRKSIKKTAYVSYFSEIISNWFKKNNRQKKTYNLFYYVLSAIDKENISSEILSIFFQIRFMSLSGFSPNLTNCIKCKKNLFNETQQTNFIFYFEKGGLLCDMCKKKKRNKKNIIMLSKGTIKQILLINNEDTNKLERFKFTKETQKESLFFLETFLEFYLGIKSRSLDFIRKVCK